MTLLYRLIILFCFMVDLLTIKSRNPFNKAYTVEIVRHSMVRKTDMFNKRTVS